MIRSTKAWKILNGGAEDPQRITKKSSSPRAMNSVDLPNPDLWSLSLFESVFHHLLLKVS